MTAITPEIREKLTKVYELAKRGATDGEKGAAQSALDRLLKKYNLEGINLDSLDLVRYSFKYSTELEMWLIAQLAKVFLGKNSISGATRSTFRVRQVNLLLKYLDYVTIDCAYEYFRRHMKAQWNLNCAPELKKTRKAKTRNKRREQLQAPFFTKYIIKSKLYNPEDIRTVNASDMSEQERKDSYLMDNVEGGQYNKQVVTGNLLNA